MKANGINAPLTAFEGWVLEDETKFYFFNCSECALSWIVENKPALIENQEEADNWCRGKRWCNHAEARPILSLDKSLIEILEDAESFIVKMKVENETT